MAHQDLPIEDRPIPSRIDLHAKKKFPVWGIVAIVAGVLVAAFAALCVYVSTLDTIYPHVQVMGIDVGNMTAAQAAEALQVDETYTLVLVDGDRTLTTRTLQEMGVSVDATATAQRAYHNGRDGNFLQNTITYVQCFFADRKLLPVYAVDDAALAAAAEDIRLTVENEVVDGAYELIEGEGMYLTKPKDGKQIDAAALQQTVKENAQNSLLLHIDCTFADVKGAPLSAAALHEQIAGEVQESRYDKDTGEATASRVGVVFDAETVAAQLEAAAAGERFLAQAEVTFPKATEEFLKENMFRDVLGTATTKVTGTRSRINNVRLSSQAINGKIYNPGETFWYNATVGQRTVEKGYGNAPSYVGGETVDSVGGGICQTSSTLYLAQLNANLKTVLRYCHQFVPAYILWGCDATVSWGGCDYAFRNNTDYPIKIVTEMDEENNLTVSILGTKMDDTYVEMTNAVLSRTDWSTQYVINYDMAPGSKPREIQTPYTGYFVKAYRNVYAGDGTLISSTLESTSDYEARDRIYEVDYQTYYEMFGAPTVEVIQ